MISKGPYPEKLDFVEGEVIFFDKPSGITSFDVIRKLKKIHYIKKIGHAGTLDPLATGLLILCTGKKTKAISGFQDSDKIYKGEMKLGGSTPSFDSETAVEESFDVSEITEKMLYETAKGFLGTIVQQAPIYSAIKMGGERLYKKAQRGEKPKAPLRVIEIHSFELTEIKLPFVKFEVKCSKGTYIRSLVHDFGKKLNNGAYMTALRRTQIGEHCVTNAVNFDEFEEIIEKINIVA
jgi:tRNA pseudouridine55 synthase